MAAGDEARSLAQKISGESGTISDAINFLSLYMPAAIEHINSVFAPRQLSRSPEELLSDDPRKLSAYRTRMGQVLEYALCASLDNLLARDLGDDFRLTFVIANEYPDLVLRNDKLTSCLRVEAKAVDAASAEPAARFEVLKGLIEGEKDIAVLIGWKWSESTLTTGTTAALPQIFSYVCVPAVELANERDLSVELRGGRVTDQHILVPSKSDPQKLTKDQGNAGKILRLVHQTRRSEPFELSEWIRDFLQFTDEVRSHL